jgi:hypothetical protein
MRRLPAYGACTASRRNRLEHRRLSGHQRGFRWTRHPSHARRTRRSRPPGGSHSNAPGPMARMGMKYSQFRCYCSMNSWRRNASRSTYRNGLLVLFLIVHVLLVFITGALRSLKYMDAPQGTQSWPGFWIFGASLVVITATFLARPASLSPSHPSPRRSRAR